MNVKVHRQHQIVIQYLRRMIKQGILKVNLSFFKTTILFCFRLKCRDLIANALSISELPEGSADPVELAARVEDGRKKNKSKK